MILSVENFDLLTSISDLHQKMLIPVNKKYDLNYTELSILLFLANHPQFDTATDIVRRRRLAKSHVSAALRSLEEKGLLRREYRDGNRRTVHLVLEPASDTPVKDGRAVQEQFFDLMHNGFTSNELKQLEKLYNKINENVFEALKEYER